MVYMTQLFPDSFRGTLIGLMSANRAVTSMFAPMLGAYLYSLSDSYPLYVSAAANGIFGCLPLIICTAERLADMGHKPKFT